MGSDTALLVIDVQACNFEDSAPGDKSECPDRVIRGEGGEWDKAFAYFVSDWKDVVLPRLRYRFSVGPVDWENPPGRQ